MINKNDLKKIARLYEMRPWQQEKHYIQSLILVAMGKEPVVLKGGTYLWLFNNLPRFSEDLDFTASGRLSKNLPEMVSESLEFFGVDNALKIISDDEKIVSFRVGAKGPLNTSDIDLCHVYIEISRRGKNYSQTCLHFNKNRALWFANKSTFRNAPLRSRSRKNKGYINKK